MLVWGNLSLALPEGDANLVVHTHAGLPKRKFCNPRTSCEPDGAHSFWVGATHVLPSQSEMRTPWCTLTLRTLWCTLILGRRNVSFAFSERDANPMVHTESGVAKREFGTP
jgi:hypothetical protein